jgi:hypothetical protein
MSFIQIDALTGLETGTASQSPALHEERPDAVDGQQIIEACFGYPETMYWSPEARAFRTRAAGVLTVGRFKLLLTQPERIAIREAGAGNAEVFDALDLLSGFSSGIALDDPVLAGFLAQMVANGLLAPERVPQILAGEGP